MEKYLFKSLAHFENGRIALLLLIYELSIHITLLHSQKTFLVLSCLFILLMVFLEPIPCSLSTKLCNPQIIPFITMFSLFISQKVNTISF